MDDLARPRVDWSSTPPFNNGYGGNDAVRAAEYGLVLSCLFLIFVVSPALFPCAFAGLCLLSPRVRHSGIAVLMLALSVGVVVAAQEVSGDTANYVRAYGHLDASEPVLATAYRWTASIEPIFWYGSYLMKLVFGDQYRLFLFSWAVVNTATLAIGLRLIDRRSWPLAIGLFLASIYFHYALGNAMRQGAAMGFTVLGLGLVRQARHWWALVAGLAAAACHVTAIALLPFYLIARMRREMWWTVITVIYAGAFVSIVTFPGWSASVLEFAPHAVYRKLSGYLSAPGFAGTLISFNALRVILLAIALFIIKSVLRVKLCELSVPILFVAYVFGLQLALSSSEVFFNRLALYRMPVEFAVYAWILLRLRERWFGSPVIAVVILCLALVSWFEIHGVVEAVNMVGRSLPAYLLAM